MKASLVGLFLVALALIATELAKPGVAQGRAVGRAFKRDNALGAEFLIIGNAKFSRWLWHERQIAVFVEPQSFTVENIRTVFLHLSERHPAEDHLEIDAVSNDEQLDDKVRWFAEIQSFPFGSLTPPPTTDASKNEPLSAQYFRCGGDEYFIYYPASGEPIPMYLKSALPGCVPSGEPAVDIVDASRRGCKAAVEQLLDAGADPNVKTRHGGAALVEASFWGQAKIVNLLLERGVDINQTSASGWTALIAAISGNRYNVIDLLLSRRRRPDVNVRGEDGRTALTHAVLRENLGVVKELLRRGSDVNVTDGYGKTALMIAEEQNNKNLIRLLKKAGANQ